MRAVLAYIEYENIKRKDRKAVGIHLIEKHGNPFYPKEVELYDFDLCSSSPTFQIQSHMYVYLPDYRCRHTASLVLIASDGERIEKIESGTYIGAQTSWNCFSNTIFYSPAQFKAKCTNSEEDFDNNIPNEVTSAGVWAIRIHFSGKQELLIHVKVLPSISENDYQMMLMDLVRIRQDLALNTRGSVGFDSKWEHINVDFAKQVSDLKSAISLITVSPKTNLRQEYALQKVHKIHKFSTKSIQNIYLNGKQSVNAISYNEDYNIYEHRAIKLYLQQLKRLCTLHLNMADIERKQTLEELTELCQQHPIKRFLWERINQNKDLIEDLFSDRRIMIPNLNPVTITVEFYVTNPNMDCIYDDKTHRFGLFPVLFKNEAGYFSAEPIEADFSIYHTKKFDFLGVNIQYTNLIDLVFFYKCIQTIKASKAKKQVKIEGQCICIPETTPKGAQYPTYSFIFSSINKITLDGVVESIHSFTKANSLIYIDKLKDDLLFDAWRDDKIRFELETMKKRELLQSLKDNNRINNQFKGIISDIDSLLSCPILCKLKPCKKIHVTPLFQRDSRYHKVFSIMKRHQQQLKSIDLTDVSKYPLRKACDIYEYWCFIKILSIFITDYSFEIKQIGNEKSNTVLNLINDIHSYISHGSYKGTHIHLYNQDLDMNVELIYNGSLEQKEKPGNPLYPDYQLIIKKDDSFLHFCMDAKYRKYNVQTTEWKRDLVDVAKRKYIDSSKKYVNGSYILHSDENTKPFYASNKSNISQNIGELSEIDAYVCRIGSVDLLPQSTIHFKTLLQMIFEYFVGGEVGYRKKCWMCGSNDVTVRCLQTSGGFPKYHMTCKNPVCNAFWVENHCSEPICNHQEFGKHLNNYLEESVPGNCWLVKCPICEHDGQPNLIIPMESNQYDHPYMI